MLSVGFHLPSEVSDFGKGHTLDLAYIMEERRHELAYLHREENCPLPSGPAQVSIQPIIGPGKDHLQACTQALQCTTHMTLVSVALSSAEVVC